MAKSSEFGVETKALQTVLEALAGLNDEVQQFVYQAAGQRLNLSAAPAAASSGATPPDGQTTNEAGMTAKQFVAHKKPQTDVERVVVLGYYLAHRKNTPHFKTLDISKLNTDAAETPFTNASQAVTNATSQNRFLAAAGKGAKQMTAYGEDFVKALPDRAAADKVKAQYKKRRRTRKKAGPKKKKRTTRGRSK